MCVGRDDDPLVKYLRGDDRITLGKMLNEIHFPNARTEAGRRFRQWLDDKHLLVGLRCVDLTRLNRLIPEKHANGSDTPSWENAEGDGETFA